MDPTGDLPVVFHAGEATSQEFDETLREKYKDAGQPLKPDELPIRMMAIVNQDTGQVQPIEFEERYRPEMGTAKPEIWTPYRRLESVNNTQWTDEMLKLFNYQKELSELSERLALKEQQAEAIQKAGLQESPEYKEKINQLRSDAPVIAGHIQEVTSRFQSALTEAYDKVVKFKPVLDDKKKEAYENKLKGVTERYEQVNTYVKNIKKDYDALQEQAKKARTPEEQQVFLKQIEKYESEAARIKDTAEKLLLDDLAKLNQIGTPQVWRPVKDFAKEKTAETVADAMHKSYKTFGEKSPFVAIENFWPHTAMSTGAELRDAVMQARALLATKLVKEEHKSAGDAKKIAEKLIGATWDVGHINNLRKAGFEGGALTKRVIEETQRIADVTKHVHITDNFGFHDSHLPPGMGNVPVREMMEALEKQGFQGRGIVEAGGFVAEVGGNPVQQVLTYFESPLYRMGPGPYWSQLQQQQASYPGYMSTFVDFPQTHFNLYGSSFTTLPRELGGQMGGEKTRFSDTPNA